MVNNVIGVVNYVIAARLSLLNFVIADKLANDTAHGRNSASADASRPLAGIS